MNHYIEVTLIKNDDFSPYELWSRIFTQLHIAFAEIKDDTDKVNIGISFPQYHFNQEKRIGFLGEKIRLFASSEADLQTLDIKKRLDRLADYVHISSIREVPTSKITGYAT